MGEELPVASYTKRILTYGEHTMSLLTVPGSKPSNERGETHTSTHQCTQGTGHCELFEMIILKQVEDRMIKKCLGSC